MENFDNQASEKESSNLLSTDEKVIEVLEAIQKLLHCSCDLNDLNSYKTFCNTDGILFTIDTKRKLIEAIFETYQVKIPENIANI